MTTLAWIWIAAVATLAFLAAIEDIVSARRAKTGRVPMYGYAFFYILFLLITLLAIVQVIISYQSKG
jgi:uncharacterized membrane protein